MPRRAGSDCIYGRSPAANASAGVEDVSADVTVCVCVCVCAGRTTLLIERLLHYYNRQEPPMKGSRAFQTVHSSAGT